MQNKIKQIATLSVFLLLIGIGSLWAILKPADAFSATERRNLAAFPPLSLETVGSGDFMKNFEQYATDQFPLREPFRRTKAMSAKYLFFRKENNGLYEVNSNLSKLDYPLSEASVDRAAERFQFVFDTYLADTETRAYLAVIPDKNAFLAEQNGYPAMDYDALYERIYEKTPFLTPIELRGELTLSDFYRTDSHLRQECLLPVADRILSAMGTRGEAEHETVSTPYPFYGVWHGQAALPVNPDSLSYLTGDALDSMKAYDHQNGREIPLFDETLAQGKDPYEAFLSGSLSLVSVENPKAESDRELIVFRDSFGSAIGPLLAEGYRKVTLVDIRYLHPSLLGHYLEFDSQDVLFLYSTSVLNHSETIK